MIECDKMKYKILLTLLKGMIDMEFKKCPRCGNFFNSEMDVCQACKTNESLDIQKLKNFFEQDDYEDGVTVQEISMQTGINSRNLNRYLLNDDFSGYIGQGISNK